MLRFRFLNYLKRPEAYKCTVGSPGGDFEGEATVQAPAAEGGEYTCQLKGTALPPRPQGPFVIKGGAAAQVNFKNVLTVAGDFSFVCDPPALFTVAKPKENVPPKKAIVVPVTYKPDGASSGKVSGKLTVSGPDGFTQLYYLTGE